MSRFSRAAIGLVTGLVCVVALSVESHAQWWQVGSGPWGGMRYRGPLLSIDIGPVAPPVVGRPEDNYSYGLVPPPVPPWHYRYDPPQPPRASGAQERFYYDLDRTHRYRTREERYADDFRDRYATGDPFYHSYSRGLPPTLGRAQINHSDEVPGVSYGPADGHSRSFVADAEVADLLRPAANRLMGSLSRKRDGAVWMKHLQPDRIIQAIDRAEFPGVLTDLVEQYEGVSQNPRLVLIAEAEGFRDTHRLLSQYVLLQSRFPASDFPDQEYEVFMNAGQRVLEEDAVAIESYPSLEPPLNPVAPLPPTAAQSDREQMIEYLPAPIEESGPQP